MNDHKSLIAEVEKQLAERKFRKLCREMIRAGHYPTDVKRSWPQAAATPKAVKTFDPSKLPPAELPDNPSLADIARQLGVKLEQLQQASGSMSLERLMQLLGAETPDQLVESLNLIIGNGPKALSRQDRLRVGVARARLAGRRVGQLLKLEKAKAARAEALKRHQAVTKRR